MNNGKLISPIVFGVLLVVSVIAFIVFPQDFQRRLMIFPDTAGGDLHREWHNVPRRPHRLDQVRLFVEELALGPVQLGAIPFIPETTELRSIALSDADVVYLDYSPEIMFDESGAERSVDEIGELIDRNIRHNFRWVDGVVLTIGGQIPDAPRFERIGR